MANSNLQTIVFSQPIGDVYEAFAEAIIRAGMDYPIKNEKAHQLTSAKPFLVEFLGEKIFISMQEASNGETSVQVKSESAFPFTLYDMGKNKQNVDTLVMHAKNILKSKE
jgi:hypothetical protein